MRRVKDREVLRSSIEKSTSIGIAVDRIGSRLRNRSHNFVHLQASVKDIADKCVVYGIRDRIDRAIGPAGAVLRVMDVVYDLQDAVDTDPRAAGISVYLANVKRLKDALKLLADNSKLLIVWIEDAVQFLKKNVAGGDDDWYLVRVSKVLRILSELRKKGEAFHGGGGVLCSAFDSLEREYRRILSTGSDDESFPVHVMRELEAIIEVLAANDRFDRCLSVYTEGRIANARATLQAHDVDYLDLELSETVSVQTVEGYISRWDKHMEFVARHLLPKEFKLCREVYQKFGSDVWMHCFAKIATRSGFIDIIEFGSAVCDCKKEAMKLLILLKIFSTLDKLRLDFNELFGGKFCLEIQNRTRELVKKVVDGACEIFWELLLQVELQRATSPPPDGSIPRIVGFVATYCNQLLEDENRMVLSGVLEIHQVWNRVKFDKGYLSNEIYNIMKALEINFETWAQEYDDAALSHLFMMNNYWYLSNAIRGTKVGDIMGDSWHCACDESTEYYLSLYMRESWEQLLVLLREDDLVLFPGGRAVNRNLVNERISAFCEAFEDMYKKHSKWTLSDKGLRWKTRRSVIEAIVPTYRSYLQKFMPGFEYETEMRNHVKYSGDRLENMIDSLFVEKLGIYGSGKCTDIIGIENVAAMNHFSSTTAAA